MQSNLDTNFLGRLWHHKRFWIPWELASHKFAHMSRDKTREWTTWVALMHFQEEKPLEFFWLLLLFLVFHKFFYQILFCFHTFSTSSCVLKSTSLCPTEKKLTAFRSLLRNRLLLHFTTISFAFSPVHCLLWCSEKQGNKLKYPLKVRHLFW